METGSDRVDPAGDDAGIIGATPWTPSTKSQIRCDGGRVALISRTIAAIDDNGTFRPLLECTQVIPRTRVFGPIASRVRRTISSSVIFEAS